MRKDLGGDIWETVFDVVSLGASIMEVAANPADAWAWAGLVGDALDLIPIVTGAWEAVCGLKVLNKVDDIPKLHAAKRVDVPKVVGVKACFVAGTFILTSTGQTVIEEIRAGDMVWAENPETGEKGLKKVIQTFENKTYELVHVYVNGEEIITTPTHPFYVPKKGWTGAVHLRAGDILILQSGKYVVVEKIQHEILEAPITVYNFEVEDYHTYYVGESSILVHNICPNPGGRHGGQIHRTKIDNIKKDLISKGWDVAAKESRVYVGGGTYRYPDIVATKNGVTRFYQVGRRTVSGKPVARELRALRDLSGHADKIFFIPYN